MKFTWVLVAMVAMLIGLATGCAKTEEDVQPAIEEADLRQVVQGKWRIERVNNKLCRGGSCTALIYAGKAGDFFEFRTDSAFIQHASFKNANSIYRDSFKADYSEKGTFLLSNFGWSARFKIMRYDARSLVLEGTYAGSDPSALFTDTYFLHR